MPTSRNQAVRPPRSRDPVGKFGMLAIDSVVIDLRRGLAKRHGRPLRLQPRQFELLEYLARNAGSVVSRDTLARAVWRDPTATWTNVITVTVHGLRRQLEQDGFPTILHTVRGQGYRLGDPAD